MSLSFSKFYSILFPYTLSLSPLNLNGHKGIICSSLKSLMRLAFVQVLIITCTWPQASPIIAWFSLWPVWLSYWYNLSSAFFRCLIVSFIMHGSFFIVPDHSGLFQGHSQAFFRPGFFKSFSQSSSWFLQGNL